MKVVLLQDVARLGKKLSVVEVPDGHARNFLIPKRMALPATKENLKMATDKTGSVAASETRTKSNLEAVLHTLKDQVVEIKAEANEQGGLFRAVSAEEIAAAASVVGGSVLPEEVRLPQPIKAIGEYDVVLEYKDVRGEIKIRVIKK